MQVLAEMVTALSTALEPYGITISDEEAQFAFATVINNSAGTNETIVNAKAREIWNAKKQAAEAPAGP